MQQPRTFDVKEPRECQETGGRSVSSFRVPASKNKVVEKESELQDVKDGGEFRGHWGTSSSSYKGENGTAAGVGLACVLAVHWRSLQLKSVYDEGELYPSELNFKWVN